jgi:hypothetical protein
MLRWTRVACLISAFVASGCAYQAEKRAAGWLVVDAPGVRLRTTIRRADALALVGQMQRIRDVLAGNALRCADRADRGPVEVTALPWHYLQEVGPSAEGHYRSTSVSWLAEFRDRIVVWSHAGKSTLQTGSKRSRSMKQLFQHELAHHLIDACFPNTPIWLHEGLASLLETTHLQRERVTFGVPRFILVKSGSTRYTIVDGDGLEMTAVGIRQLPTLDELFAASREGRFYRNELGFDRTTAYAAAWALVHMLELGDDELRPRFARYLQSLRGGKGDPDALFAQAFQGVPLQSRFTGYVRRGEFQLLLKPIEPPTEVSVRVRSMSPAEAHLEWARLLCCRDDRANREHLREHLLAAKRSPETRSRAHLLAALRLVADKDLAGAEREVLDGLRTDPKNPSLLEARLDLQRRQLQSVPAGRSSSVGE